MEFSLIIPTLHRTNELSRLLQSLVSQNVESFSLDQVEVLIVDQNTDDRLRAVLAPYEPHLQIRHLRLNKMNASAAKNLGLAHAKGRFIAFPDDDCWYDPNTLETAYRLLSGSKGGIFGKVRDPRLNEDLIRYPGTLQMIAKPNDPRVFLGLQVAQFYRREAAFATGGFDEKLGPGTAWPSGEETDFAISVLKKGFPIIFAPQLFVYHPMVDSRSMSPQKVRNYAFGFGGLCKKHGLSTLLLWKVLKQLAGVPYFVLQGDIPRALHSWRIASSRTEGYLKFTGSNR